MISRAFIRLPRKARQAVRLFSSHPLRMPSRKRVRAWEAANVDDQA